MLTKRGGLDVSEEGLVRLPPADRPQPVRLICTLSSSARKALGARGCPHSCSRDRGIIVADDPSVRWPSRAHCWWGQQAEGGLVLLGVVEPEHAVEPVEQAS